MYIAHISDLHIGDPSKPGEENLKRCLLYTSDAADE